MYRTVEQVSNVLKMTINVKIAERPYPLIVEKAEEEEQIRKAAQYINEILLQFRKSYSGQDMQDLLALAAIKFVVRIFKLENNPAHEDISGKLDRINSKLEEFLIADDSSLT
jgi:cell division protein ZapA